MSRPALYQMSDQILDQRETTIHFPIMQLIHELHAKDKKWEHIMSQSDRFPYSDELVVLRVYQHALVLTYLKTVSLFFQQWSMLTTFSVLYFLHKKIWNKTPQKHQNFFPILIHTSSQDAFFAVPSSISISSNKFKLFLDGVEFGAKLSI